MKTYNLLIFIFVLASYLSSAQDLIIKSDSTKIMCKIIKEDSLAIRYKENKSKNNSIQIIKKSNVLKYYNSSSLIIDEDSMTHFKKTNYAAITLLKADTIFRTKTVNLYLNKKHSFLMR